MLILLGKKLKSKLITVAAVLLGTAAASAYSAPKTILVLGDSLSAEYGLARGAGWVALMAPRLKQDKIAADVVNASVSGETTAGGLARLPRALSLHHPAVVVVELGGNDGLRALPIEQMRANLAHMIDLAKGAGAKVLLLGMRIPPNYGPQYTEQFGAVYADLARDKHVPLVPFLLVDVALHPDLMQADGVHPVEAAQPLLLAIVWPTLEPLLKR